MTPCYVEQLQRLYRINQFSGMKLGLKNIECLCAAFNFPEKKFRSIHVAGTNGKGSVTTKIASALQLQGLRVGLYTSPHIATFRERIRINGEMISEISVVQLLNDLFNIIDNERIPATLFEMTTTLAFLYFANEQIDIAVIETGLGGRLDSTNIITPELAAITSISLEHTEILGDTLEAITIEKAGIIKPGCPVVIGPRVPLHVISPIAKAKEALCKQVSGNFIDYDAENSAIARCCLELLSVPETYISRGIGILPPCRMEQLPLSHLDKQLRPQAIILDVAHNPDGLSQLFMAIQQRYPGHPLRIVCGLSSNKDIQGCASVLKEHGSSFHCIGAKNIRALPPKELLTALHAAGIDHDKLHLGTSLEESLSLALPAAAKGKEILVICGTFFIMANVRRYFGIIEPFDPVELIDHSSQTKF